MAASLREQLKHATQLRVLAAASRLFRERGFAATTVRDIAEAADVSAGTVMAVGDKNALLVRIFDAMVADEHGRRAGRDRQLSVNGSDSCVQRLSVLVQPFVAMFTGSPELARSYASILVSGNHSSSLFTELTDRLVEEFATAVTEHGCTSQADAPAKAQALYAAYVGTLFTWSALGLADPSRLTDSLRTSFAAISICKE
ncbi:TetR/AcrR family transcriptional regulator [Nakamurella aerolata]|uniref:TetR/AcrR family transcriptional regulator n=1 Tax=Nakamurella aerolata TaxID=1656892 RepID=A0A849A580_9ACTN|nr:TetR/AcrR family transcriptional regulator [Nakamurella aerolata]NNG34796.1 TetR/AcrR family transcriptional regulator [Nakamurella aerolata]